MNLIGACINTTVHSVSCVKRMLTLSACGYHWEIFVGSLLCNKHVDDAVRIFEGETSAELDQKLFAN